MTQTVLITGASSGFGEACARQFAASGDRLVLLARRAERLDRLREELAGQAEVHTLAVDVTDSAAVDAGLAELPAAFREVDVLVNNAGLALGLEPSHEAELDDWERMIETNVTALVRLTRRLLPGMVERDRGHVVNIGSIAGRWPYPGGNVYGASKAFVQQFSRELRADLLGSHVRVTNIDPGMSETEFSLVRFKQDVDKAAQVYEDASALTPDDVAEAVHWVCSRPAHVNINSIELMPVCQAWGPLAVKRDMD